MKQWIIASAVAGAVALSPVSALAQALGMGAGAQGSQNYAVNGVLTNFLAEKLGLDLRLQSFGGSGASMPLINNGRLDMQAIVSPDVIAGVLAQEPFAGMTPMGNIKVIAALGPSYYGFMVQKGSAMQSVADVKGQRMTYGFTGQPTLRLQVDGILANGGLEPGDVQPVLVPSVPRGVDDLIAGQADVAFFALRGGKTREADAAIGIRWLALVDTPEAEAAMQEWVPGSYVATVAPEAGILGIDTPTPMMAYDYWLVAGAHVDDELAYSIAKLIAEQADAVAKLHGTLGGFTKDLMVPANTFGVSLHPGAERYYREAGMLPAR